MHQANWKERWHFMGFYSENFSWEYYFHFMGFTTEFSWAAFWSFSVVLSASLILFSVTFQSTASTNIPKYILNCPGRKQFSYLKLEQNMILKCQILANQNAAAIGLDKWKQFSLTFKNITIISFHIKMKTYIETTVILSLLRKVTANSQRKQKKAAKSEAPCYPPLFCSILCKEGTIFSEWNGALRPESVGSVQIVCNNSIDPKNFLWKPRRLWYLLSLPTQCSWWAPRCTSVTQTAMDGFSVFLKLYCQ